MINKDNIEHLAKLSRIELGDKSTESLAKDIESILGYVDQIKEASVDLTTDLAVEPPSPGENRNVLREDTDPHESGIHTEKILNESPDREGDFIKVKNIL